MSILINGLDMPKNCDFCPILDWEYGYCNLLKKNVKPTELPEDCPLLPVPPHGRLIIEEGEIIAED